MNVHTRSKVAAIIAVMFLVNFYYFKSWRKEPRSSTETNLQSGSHHRLTLTKLLAPGLNCTTACQDNNCSIATLGSHVVPLYYIRDEASDMTSYFVQRSHWGSSEPDVSVSIIQVDPGGFVNTEKVLTSRSMTKFLCKADSKTIANDVTREGYRNIFHNEINHLVENIQSTNQKSFVDFKQKNVTNQTFLVISSNCIENIIDQIKNIVRVEEQDICRKRIRDFETLYGFLSDSIKMPRIFINNATLNEFYYGKYEIGKLEKEETRHWKMKFSKHSTTEKHETQNTIENCTTPEMQVNDTDKTTRNELKDKTATMKPLQIIYSIENLTLSEKSKKEERQEPLSTNDTNKSGHMNNTTAVHENEKVPKTTVVELEKGTESNIKKLINEETTTNKLKMKKRKENEEKKIKAVNKTNGLNTLLVFKNLNEINDLYDKTFNPADFANSASVELSNTHKERERQQAVVKSQTKDIHRSLPHQNNLEININILNATNAEHLRSPLKEKINRATQPKLTKNQRNYEKSTVDDRSDNILRFSTENYAALQNKSDQELAKEPFIALSEDLVKTKNTFDGGLRDEPVSTRTNKPQLVSPEIIHGNEKTSSHLNIFRSLTRAMMTSTITPSHVEEGSTKTSNTPDSQKVRIFGDNIDENTKDFVKFIDSTSPTNYSKAYTTETLEKKSKLVDKSEIVHTDFDLYDSEPRHKIIRTHAYSIDQEQNHPIDDNIRIKDIGSYAALISPPHQISNDFPHKISYTNSFEKDMVTLDPFNDGEEDDSDITDIPLSITPFKQDNNLTKSNSITSHEHSTYQYDSPQNTPSTKDSSGQNHEFTDYPFHISSSNKTSFYEDFTEYEDENTDLKTEGYQDMTTPKLSTFLENTEHPFIYSTTINPTINVNKNQSFRTKYNKKSTPRPTVDPSIDDIDTNSEEISIHMHKTKDFYYQDYHHDYNDDRPSSYYNNLDISTESLSELPEKSIYHTPVNPTITHYVSAEIEDGDNGFLNVPEIAHNKPLITHHGFSSGSNFGKTNPFGHVDSDYFKTVEPTKYMTAEKFRSYKSKNKPVIPQTFFSGEYNNGYGSSAEEDIGNHDYNTMEEPVQNHPLEAITLSPADVVINDFLNSPIDWKEFEGNHEFNYRPNIDQDNRAPDTFKQTNQSGDSHNYGPLRKYQDVLDAWRNKQVVDKAISNSPYRYDHRRNNLSQPLLGKIIPSSVLGDTKSFQPIHVDNGFFQPPNNSNNLGLVKHHVPIVYTVPESNPVPTSLRNSANQLLKNLHENSMREAVSLLGYLQARNTQLKKPTPYYKSHTNIMSQEILNTVNPFTIASKGIDIFFPKKSFHNTDETIDIIKPTVRSNSMLSTIKLKPFDTEIINPIIEFQNKYPQYKNNIHANDGSTLQSEMNKMRHNQEGYEPIKNLEQDSSFQEYFRPLDLSMVAGQFTPVVSFFNNTPSLKDTLDRSTSAANSSGSNIPFGSNWTHPVEISFKKFNSEQEINLYLKHISHLYSHKVTLLHIGTSVEGRPIYGVKVSHGGDNPMVLIDGGIHAREWISPAVVLYALQQLVEQPENFTLMRQVDWLLVPLLNPDGYVYSMIKDRMWRKNRARPRSNDGNKCYGVDLNRNFGVFRSRRHIDSDSRGASDDPCANNYRGHAPFSEPESRAFRDLVMENKKRIKLYLSFHSYGQYIMYPWGYKRPLPNDWKELEKLAIAVRGAILNITGTKYRVGSTADIMGMNSGGSDDWMKGYVGVNYSYTIELPGGGTQGFDLPTARIQDVVSEIFEGIKVFSRFVENKFTRSRG